MSDTLQVGRRMDDNDMEVCRLTRAEVDPVINDLIRNIKDRPTRVRFAPSPTGDLHLGGARTALFNYLVARQSNTKMILRIEDTDQDRGISPDSIFESLRWLGIEWGELYFQSARLDIYRRYADILLSNGSAYHCYCTDEDILTFKNSIPEKLRDRTSYKCDCREIKEIIYGKPFCVKFWSKNPDIDVKGFWDKVYGHIDAGDIPDFTIVRTNGYPLYNFSTAIDDLEMGITLVIRGNDHIQNTVCQKLIYCALGRGIEMPDYAHLPMLLANRNEKLSKRHGAASVLAYRDMGYSPQGLLSYLSRFGWSNKDEELFTMDDLVEKFQLSKVGRSDGIFDPKKAAAINSKYIKKLATDNEIYDELTYHAFRQGVMCISIDKIHELISFVKTYPNYKDMAEASIFALVEPSVSQSQIDELLQNNEILEMTHVQFYRKQFSDLILGLVDPLTVKSIHEAFREYLNKTTFDQDKNMMREIPQVLRLFLTGNTKSLDLAAIVFILGKDEASYRLMKDW